MKKRLVYIPVIVAMAFALPAFSQTEKGNFLIGGSASFHTASQNSVKTTSFGLSPEASYFFLNRFAGGIITSFGTGTSKLDDGSSKNTTTSFYIGPTVRYYFPLNEQWAVFPKVDYTFGTSSSKITTPSGTTSGSSNTSLFKAGAGLTYFLAKNVGVEGILYYQGLSLAGSTQSSVNFSVGLQVYINRKNQ